MGRTVYYDHYGNEVEPPKADSVPTTNADRIRAMSDEELATRLYLFTCVHVFDSKVKCEDNGCKKCWLGWLRQECD